MATRTTQTEVCFSPSNPPPSFEEPAAAGCYRVDQVPVDRADLKAALARDFN